MLTLKGKEPIYIGIGSTYQEPGYSVKTVGGQELSNDLVQITIKGQNTGNTTLDTSIEETYTITYTVEYKGNSSTKTRTVHVGNYNPSIEIEPNGTSKYSKAMDVNIKVQAHEQFHVNSFRYTLTKDGVEQTPITVNKTSETITLDQDGIYRVKIETTDDGGNSSTLTSEPYKIDVTPPTITMSNVTITSAQAPSYNLMTGVTVADNSGVTPTVTTSGSLSTTEKTYTITYTVTDEAGNVTIKNRSITVNTPLVSDIVKESSDVMTNDPDGNPRYVGPNPKNYVKFNNELWRIIGTFNGQAKIIRNEPYSTEIAWNVNNVNDWSQATLKTELNGTFLNGIDSTSKSLMNQSYKWNLGGIDTNVRTRSEFYNKERGTEVYSGRPTTWTGAIGLMYPSDYGYATSSTNDICNTSVMSSWNNDTDATAYTLCAQKSWLYNSSKGQWTLTPKSDSSYAFHVRRTGDIHTYNDGMHGTNSTAYSATPALFLKSTVKIQSGTGTNTDPFILTQ